MYVRTESTRTSAARVFRANSDSIDLHAAVAGASADWGRKQDPSQVISRWHEMPLDVYKSILYKHNEQKNATAVLAKCGSGQVADSCLVLSGRASASGVQSMLGPWPRTNADKCMYLSSLQQLTGQMFDPHAPNNPRARTVRRPTTCTAYLGTPNAGWHRVCHDYLC